MSSYRPRLVEAFLFFADAIRAYLEDRESRPAHIDRASDHLNWNDPASREYLAARAELVLEAISGHLQLVTIELEHDEDPQVIFETLNARGVPLLPSDLVRRYLFLVAQREKEPLEPLYDQFWKRFDVTPPLEEEKQPFWKEEVKQGRYKRPRIDLFSFTTRRCMRKERSESNICSQSIRPGGKESKQPRALRGRASRVGPPGAVRRLFCGPPAAGSLLAT